MHPLAGGDHPQLRWPAPEVVVVGQIARDVVLLVDEAPPAGGTCPVRDRREMLGGKGANQALGLAQLGLRAAVIGAVGDDPTGGWLLEQAFDDGIDIRAVDVRPRCASSLIVSLVDSSGSWRYAEDVVDDTLVQPADVRRSSAFLAGARAVTLQMQQPAPAVVEAAETAGGDDRLVIVDGAPADGAEAERILARADVVRADGREAEILAGRSVAGPKRAARAAEEIRARGPSIVVLESGDGGDTVAWDGGHAFVPHQDTEVVDTTGGGDAFVAALTASLLRGHDPLMAACAGSSAAASVVCRLGGRPDLSPEAIWQRASQTRERIAS